MQDKKAIEIIAGAFRKRYEREHPDCDKNDNPYSLSIVDKFKEEYASDAESFLDNHKDIAYYFDGLMNVKISQSVHPAGIIISPITLKDNYGVFYKDGETVFQLDMDQTHDVNLVKYDMLVLRNIAIIRDACRLAKIPYPKMHEIDWNDEKVWRNMLESPVSIFEFEGDYAFSMLKKFEPHSIFDMSLVTACIRPSGASYRNDLLERKYHKNPSVMIDELLKDNYGYLVYQEDIIAFLQNICGLTGSEADTVRRGIAKKNMESLERMMPKIINGYCDKSDQPRDIAEQEVQEYLRVIADASSYMFNYNHSVSYCLIGYICAWLRTYYPYELIASLLNNAANESDIVSATQLASQYHVTITPPRYRSSSDIYGCNEETHTISKGAASIKYMNSSAALGLYDLGHTSNAKSFSETLCEIHQNRIADERQIELLIYVEYFSEFGNIAELLRIFDMVKLFKYGEAKSFKCDKVGKTLKPIIEKYASNLKKDGTPGTAYKFNSQEDAVAMLVECESLIKSYHMEEIPIRTRIEKQMEYLGYATIESERNRNTLYVSKVDAMKSKKTGGIWSYRINTVGLKTGKQSSMYVRPYIYNRNKISDGDIIRIGPSDFHKNDRGYYDLNAYTIESRAR